MTTNAWLLRATVPLDAARRSVFRMALGRERLVTLIARRDSRLATLLGLQASVAFALALFCPVLLLVIGPILLGVAHVVADVRHLVVRRHLPRAMQHVVWGACLLLILLRGLAESHRSSVSPDTIEWALVTAWALLFAVLGGASAGSVRRASLGALVVCALGVAALADPVRARFVFVQLHNVVALVLWVALFRKRRRSVMLPLALVTVGALLLGSGKLYAVTLHQGQAAAFGVHVLAASDWMVPGLRADHAIGLTCAFVFLQSVHYAVWLFCIPQDDQRFESPRSFRASLRELFRDFGGGWLFTIALAALAVVGFALVDAVRTRHLYLSLAMFHGYLELALGAYFWARGNGLRGSAP